ncbi:hypothetical protein GCM10008922_10670 [Faecalicatena contorta]|uniref:hypothetical protein n=1 Tax=Faecalicatena contorta TaxID=39482 RepID=UPI0031D0B029
MFVRKKEFEELKERVERLEDSESEIITAEHGKRSLKWYIRMFCANVKSDPSKKLRSWGD